MKGVKNHYYVLVFTDYGPVFVTGIPNRNYAEWKKEKRPMEFSKASAEDIAYGLNLNGYMAAMVVYPFEKENQLYYYENGQFQWVNKEKEEKVEEQSGQSDTE